MDQILRALQIHSLEIQLGDVGFIIECAERLGGDAAALHVLHAHAEALRKQLRSVCEGLEYQAPKEEPVIYGTHVELNPGETITVIDFLRKKGRQWSTNAAAVGCMAVAEWRRQNPGKEICKVHDGMFVHNAYEADSLPILERVFGKLLKREVKEQARNPTQPVCFETEEWVTAEGWLTRKGLYTHARVKSVTRRAETLAKKRCEWPLRGNELGYNIYSKRQVYLLEMALERVMQREGGKE